MPNVWELLKSNLAYCFIAVGAVWLVVAALVGLWLVLWPGLTIIVGGVLLKVAPSQRITWSWSTSAAVLGFLACGYQVVVAIPVVGGVFGAVAAETLVAFLLFALAHLALIFTGLVPPQKQPV